MNSLTISEVYYAIISELDIWEGDCSQHNDHRIQNSFQVQLWNLMKQIHHLVPSQARLTYDFRKDTVAQEKGLANIWEALTYYLAQLNGEKEKKRWEDVHQRANSIRTGIYNLKSLALGMKHPLFVVPHTVGAANIEIVTFDGNYVTDTNVSVWDMDGERHKKRWFESTVARIQARTGLDKDVATVHAEAISVTVDEHLLGLEKYPLTHAVSTDAPKVISHQQD